MDARDLYGLPLERFTSERNALAGRLRQAGRREEAQTVARLRKPSVAAWAVNQLVRTQHDAIRALFEAGDALRGAHADVVAGRGNARTLRKAVETERQAREGLAQAAGGLLGAQGHELTRATLDHVSETLHAAALEEGARAQVRDGCLERALRHVGLGSVAATPAPSSGEPAPRSAREDEKAGARELERARQAELSAARRAEAQARARSERAERDLRSATTRHERATAQLREAEKALSAARLLAETTELEHRQARDRLESMEG